MSQPRIQETDFASVAGDAGQAGSLIGYRTEKRSLYKWMDRAGRRSEPVLLLSGPSGSGKTRLAQAALSRARRQGVVGCRGACEAIHGPFSPVVEALREAADGCIPPKVCQHLVQCLARRPELSELVGTGADPEARPGGGAVGKSSLFQAMAQACIALCSAGPALMVLEDCHNADDVAIEFLKYLATRARVHSLKLLITCRTGSGGALPARVGELAESPDQDGSGNWMSLGGLRESEADNLVRSLYPRNLFSAQLKRGLVSATAGNPSAIRDALRLFEAQGIIYPDQGLWRERRGPKKAASPTQLYDSLVDRLVGLSDEVVLVLRLAALSGHTADPAVVQLAAGTNRVRFMRAVGVLTRIHGVLVEADQGYEFTSDQVRRAVLDHTPEKERTRLHASLAYAIGVAHSDQRQEFVEAIAEHYVEAGDLENALPCLLEAADRAARFACHDRTLSFCDRAMTVLQPVSARSGSETLLQVLNRKAQANAALARWKAAEQAFSEMACVANRHRNRPMEAQAWHGLGRTYAKRKRYRPALDHYERALRLYLEEEDAYNQCTVLLEMGSVHLELGRHDDAEAAQSAAFGIARDRGFTARIAGITMNRAMRYVIQGDYDRAARSFEQCLSLNRKLDRKEAIVSTLINLGKCRADAGDTQTAKRHYVSALRLARHLYDLQREAIARLNLSEIFLLEGQLDTCQRACEQALERFEEIDHRAGIADASRILGRVAQERGDHYSAFRLLERSIACNRDSGYRLGEAEARRDYGRYLVQSAPRSPSGFEQLSTARAIFEELGVAQEVARLDQELSDTRNREREPAGKEHDGRSGLPPVQEPVPSPG